MAAKKSSNPGADLITAARSGNLARVKKLIAQGADIDYDPPAGTPLQNAIGAGRLEVAKLLIKAGADVNHKTCFGSLLDYAIQKDQPKIISLLIEAKANVEGNGFNSPLLHATANNKIEIVKQLLKAGAHVNETGSIICGEVEESKIAERKTGNVVFRTHAPKTPLAHRSTPLIVAVRRGHEKMAELLIAEGADLDRIDKDGFSAIAWATRLGNTRMAHLLTKHGAKQLEFPEGSPAAAFIEAAKRGDCSRLQELIEKRITPNIQQITETDGALTPLMVAAENGHEEAVKLLLSEGALVNGPRALGKKGTPAKTALMCASEKGHVGVVKVLLKHKANIHAQNSYDGRHAIHYAAEAGHAEVLRVLLKAGARPEAKSGGSDLPLILAARAGQTHAVKVLLESGANPNAAGANQYTALSSAAMSGYSAVVELLLKAGAKVTGAKDPVEAAASTGAAELLQILLQAGAKIKPTVLLSASLTGGIEAIKLLLKAGANPDDSDSQNFTALMGAVRAGNLKAVQMLLAAGANINAVDDEGHTALDLAYDNIRVAKDRAEFFKTSDKETKKAVVSLKDVGDYDMVELLVAKGGKRAQELDVTGASRTKSSEVESPDLGPAFPNFATRAAEKRYREAVAELEKVFGVKPRPMDEQADSHFASCMTFRVPTDKGLEVLSKHHKMMLKRGFYLLRHDRGYSSGKDQIAILPTADHREVLLAWQTNGANYDLMTNDIIGWLDRLKKEQPFQLTGASFDWCEGRFTSSLKNPQRLAEKMYEFCPDIVDQGTGDVASLARELSKTRQFFFWWD